jgi:hypothetical protein
MALSCVVSQSNFRPIYSSSSIKTHLIDVSNPGSYEDFVELLVPVLQERGIMWNDYAVPGGTFRENLRRKAGDKQLPANHIGSNFRYDAMKEKYADENGHIVIDRKKEAAATAAAGGAP